MGTRKNLMIVDDDEIAQFIARRISQISGFFDTIHTACNGSEALQVLIQADAGETLAPHVILLDLNMPVMDGFDFLEAMQAVQWKSIDPPHVVVLTSSNHVNDRERCMQHGIELYLVKPFNPDALKAVIASIDQPQRLP